VECARTWRLLVAGWAAGEVGGAGQEGLRGRGPIFTTW
jgi:hypothetical protein